jgi:outer membrane protein OmpA-like peptidoglycan-associated protein
MKISRYNLTWMIVLPITFGLATSGCASKKYVRSQVDVVNQRVSHVETKTKEQMAYLTNKEDAENAAAIRQTNATAEQAMQTAQSNESKISANEAALTKLDAAMNYTLIEKGDVTFGFNKSALDNEAKVALDAIIQRAQSSPRTVVELVGFTDPIGSTQYNLTLSRRRAEAVQRYLVKNNVPLRGIHIIGMGKEQPPASLTADVQAVDPNASPKDIRRLARRVYIRVYSTGLAQGEAARSTPNP